MTEYAVPSECPRCGHSPITEVIYGLIRRQSAALKRDLASGRKALGGCLVGDIAYGCRACQ